MIIKSILMIKDSDGDVFEEMRSMNQDLTFNAAATAFKKYGVEFGKEKYRTLELAERYESILLKL